MSYSLNLNKLLQDLKGPHRREALMGEVEKLTHEIEKLRRTVKPQAKAQVKKLEARYKLLVKTLGQAQMDLDREFKKTAALVKKTSSEAEKNIASYKRMAVKQSVRFQRAMKTTTATKKKATSKKA